MDIKVLVACAFWHTVRTSFADEILKNWERFKFRSMSVLENATLKAFATQILVATAFLLLCWLSLFLGVDAILIRPMWLPAALLAAVCLARGRRDTLGLMVGAAMFSANRYIDSEYAWPVACINALSIFAQVWLADLLIRKLMTERARELWQPRDLILGALILGPIVSIVKPLLVLPSLIFLFHLVPVDNFWDRTLDWMVSDSMAVYLAGPPILALIGVPREWWRARRASLIAGQALIVAAFIGSMQITANIERQRLNDRVRAELVTRLERLRSQLDQLREFGSVPQSVRRTLPLVPVVDHDFEANLNIVPIRDLPGWALNLAQWRLMEQQHFAEKRWLFDIDLTAKPVKGAAASVSEPLRIDDFDFVASLGLSSLGVRLMVSEALWRMQMAFAIAAILGTMISLLLSARQKQLGELVRIRTESLQRATNEMRLFKAIADQSTEPIVVAEPRVIESGFPVLRYANAAFLKVTQLTEEHIRASDIASLRGEHTDRQKLLSTMRALSTGRAVTDEFFHYRRDGTPYVAQMTAFPIIAENGQITHWAALYRDISEERARSAAERDQQRRSGERERHEQMGRMAGGIAHDFNNLLTAIQGSVELIRMEHPDFGGADLLEAVEQAVQSGASLTQQLLAFSGRGLGRIEKLHLDERLRSMQKVLSMSVPTDAKLQIDIESCGNYLVNVDGAAWLQAVMNLVVNAGQALPGGKGKITVSLRAARYLEPPERAQIKSNEAKAGMTCELIVSDNGTGIAAELVDQIFQPFFTTKDGGTGLGLAAIAAVTQQFAGWLVLQSTKNVGTQVHLYFPAVDDIVSEQTKLRAEQDAIAANSTRLPTGASVLIVDDESAVLAYTQSVLESVGFAVTTASDGNAAREWLIKHDFQLLVTDLTMPNGSGASLIDWIVSHRTNLPVIVMTGFSVDRTGLVERAGGTIRGWLDKPFSAPALVDLAKRATLIEASSKD